MSIPAVQFQAHINGVPVTSAELAPLAFAGFAHFTAMQVRGRKVKGLDLHLKRLHAASNTFFGRAIPDDQLKSYIKAAIVSGPENQSLSVTIFSNKGEFTAESMDVEPAVLVRRALPSNGPQGPLNLSAVNYERPLPSIKHVGEAGKTFYMHEAIRQGFDDAAFVDSNGRLSEATIWNLVFWDGEAVVWPKAAMLRGTMMGIVQRQLELLDIPQLCEDITFEKLSQMQGAAVMNSWTPGIAVTAISSHLIAEKNSFIKLLHEAYENEPAIVL